MLEIERTEYGVDSARKGYSVKARPRGQRDHLLTLKWKVELASVGNRIEHFIAKYCCPKLEVSATEQKPSNNLSGKIEMSQLIPNDVKAELKRTYEGS